MKRRKFVQMLPAGVFALSGVRSATAAENAVPRAHWIENGIIDGGGSHEPYLFVVRRGGQSLDARKDYEKAQSEETIRGLHDAGIEVFHTHLYKGFGMAAEMDEMRDTVRAAVFAHSLGMKVDVYIQWNTMMYETFFAEEPQAANWVQRDAVGRPIMLTYGFQQAYRYRPCFKNQNYLDYLKKIVRFAIEDVHADFIHFDNFDLNGEPDSCHCPVCVKGFRDHLKAKFTSEQRKERFGFSNVDYVNPPEWNLQNPPGKMQVIFDPVIQEWIDFRCQYMTDALRQMATLAKSLNREVVIEVNPHGITGANRAWEAGLDHARFLPLTQVFWTEEPNQPGVQGDGRVVSKIRSYKLARAFDNTLFTYTDRDEIALAECLAFNQTIGWAGIYPLTSAMKKYVSFYRANRAIFENTRDVADVAILRSYGSITFNQPRCQLSAILAEQALIEAAVPFHIIFDKHLENLAPYRVLVLPDSECLSDAQLTAIHRYVENGGGLVATGSAGLYDHWRRRRVKPGLAFLRDWQAPARAYEETVQRHAEEGQEKRGEYGRAGGRVCYIPSLKPDRPPAEFGPFFKIDNRYWKRPANSQQLLDGIQWVRRGAPVVEVQGPDRLIANAVDNSAKRFRAVHLVNYDAHLRPLQNITVTCHNPEGARWSSARLYSPDLQQAQKIESHPRERSSFCNVAEVKTYAIVVMEWT